MVFALSGLADISLVSVALFFIAGLLFGLGTKKALKSVVLIFASVVLGAALGLSIPILSASFVLQHVFAIISSQVSHLGLVFYSFPAFWIVGFAVGIWKG